MPLKGSASPLKAAAPKLDCRPSPVGGEWSHLRPPQSWHKRLALPGCARDRFAKTGPNATHFYQFAQFASWICKLYGTLLNCIDIKFMKVPWVVPGWSRLYHIHCVISLRSLILPPVKLPSEPKHAVGWNTAVVKDALPVRPLGPTGRPQAFCPMERRKLLKPSYSSCAMSFFGNLKSNCEVVGITRSKVFFATQSPTVYVCVGRLAVACTLTWSDTHTQCITMWHCAFLSHIMSVWCYVAPFTPW